MNFEVKALQHHFGELTLCSVKSWPSSWDPQVEFESILKNISPNSFLKRKQSFVLGRLCAQKALSQLGKSQSVGRSSDGAPVFPRGSKGSISHSNQAVVALVAQDARIESIGVDVEEEFSAETWNRIKETVLAHGDEEGLLSRSGKLALPQAGTLLFSSKESLFKALHPIVNEFFDFKTFCCVQHDSKQSFLVLEAQKNIGNLVRRSDRFTVFYQQDGSSWLTYLVI